MKARTARHGGDVAFALLFSFLLNLLVMLSLLGKVRLSSPVDEALRMLVVPALYALDAMPKNTFNSFNTMIAIGVLINLLSYAVVAYLLLRLCRSLWRLLPFRTKSNE